MNAIFKILCLIVCLNLILLSIAQGQCIVRGKISDSNGETAIGVPIYLKMNKTSGTITDLNGNYSLKINEAGTQIIVISYVGYKSIEDTLTCADNSTLINNYTLEPAATAIEEVTVTKNLNKNNDAHLETYKKLSSITLDYISSETIKKTGDANVSAAIARVTGVSTNSGGLITVRGAGDRYIKTTINGSRIPTLDPFTNNIKLDMFPATLIDNITITKTARPDLPGDWAGAFISVDTKEYPEELSINVETSIGYNTQSTFKDVVTADRSSTDWLGYDNGLREFDHNKFVNFTKQPTIYQEYTALGLEEYLRSLGVTESTEWTEEYTKLGLIQLGLLGKAQINDPTAIAKAKADYSSLDYQGKAYDIVNAEAVKSAKSLPNNWNTTTRKAPLNFSQSFSIGNQTQLFGKTLGYLLGFRYASSTQYDPDSYAYKIPQFDNMLVDGKPQIYDTLYQEVSKESNGWSGLISIAYKLNKNNSVSLMFMPNITGALYVRTGNYYDSKDYDTTYQVLVNQFYESRKQMIYQLKTEHYLPGQKIKIDLNASYTQGTSSAPDYKIIFYPPPYFIRNTPSFKVSDMGTGRYFRYLNDDIFDSQVSAEIPLNNTPDLIRKIKIGGAYQSEYRSSDMFYYQLWDNTKTKEIRELNPDADPYGLDRFDIVTYDNTRTVQQYYEIDDYPTSHVFGVNEIKAGFLLLDYSFWPALRFSGGLRVEQAHLYTDCNIFNTYNLTEEDGRRLTSGGPIIGNIFVKPGVIDKISYLPSANVILKLKQDVSAPINLRLNYSQTVARPNIQELTDNAFFDYTLKDFIRGNSQLKMVEINNYDLRFESYFKSGDNFSVSLFYKNFKNHIEVAYAGNSVGYTWKNNENISILKGIEIEGKKSILNFLEFRANLTLVDSRTRFQAIRVSDGVINIDQNIPSRTISMLGQSPYIVNAMLSYFSKKLKLESSINYNLQGPRLVIIGADPVPDIYEMPRHLLDFKIAKALGEHFGTSLKVQDILNSPVIRSYKVEDTHPLDYDKYQYGTHYVLSISYKF